MFLDFYVAALCDLGVTICGSYIEQVWPPLLYTLASLNYTLPVSEYVTTNVTAKPVTFLHETNNGCTVVSRMCSCNTLTVARK